MSAVADSVRVERRKSGALKLTTTTDDGLTFEAIQTPLTQPNHPGRYLHIRGPIEHKRPQAATFDLLTGLTRRWPANRNRRRRERFNEAAWRLIHEAEDRAQIDDSGTAP